MNIKNMGEILKVYNKSIDWLKAEGYQLELSEYKRYGDRGYADTAKPVLLEVYNKGTFGELIHDCEYTFFNSLSAHLNNYNYKESRVFLWFLGLPERIEVIAQ